MGHYSPRHRARIGRKCSPRRCRRRPMFPGPLLASATRLPLLHLLQLSGQRGLSPRPGSGPTTGGGRQMLNWPAGYVMSAPTPAAQSSPPRSRQGRRMLRWPRRTRRRPSTETAIGECRSLWTECRAAYFRSPTVRPLMPIAKCTLESQRPPTTTSMSWGSDKFVSSPQTGYRSRSSAPFLPQIGNGDSAPEATRAQLLLGTCRAYGPVSFC